MADKTGTRKGGGASPMLLHYDGNAEDLLRAALDTPPLPRARKAKKEGKTKRKAADPIEKWRDTIHVGDCAKLMAKIPAESVDLTVTSPPYDDLRHYNGYGFDFAGIAKQLLRVTKPGGVVVWVVGDRIDGGRSLTSFRQAIAFQDLGFAVHDAMIYQKKNTPFMRKNAYTNCYELMLVLAKGRPKTFNPIMAKTARSGQEMLVHNKKADGVNKKRAAVLKKQKTLTNIWSYAVGLGGTTNDRYAFEHPAMFPEKLAEDHIVSWSNQDDLVLDPMCGAGTTLKMAKLHGRSYIGLDISKDYVKLAQKRVAEVAPLI